MNERQANFRYDSELRHPTPQERELISRKWSKMIQKESKRNKIGAEIRICAVMLLLLVLFVRGPEEPFLFVAAGAVMAVCLVRTFTDLVRNSRKLKARQMLLEQGRFRVAAAHGKRLIPNWGRHHGIGVEVERISARIGGEYRVLIARKNQEDVIRFHHFPVLLAQLEGEAEIIALLQL